jgi:hypothetical protein
MNHRLERVPAALLGQPSTRILIVAITVFGMAGLIQAQSTDACAKLAGFRIDGVEITKAALIPAGTAIPPPYPGAPIYKGG